MGTFIAIFKPSMLDNAEHSMVQMYGDDAPILIRIFKIMFLLQGFVMPLVRLSEPALLRVLW